MKTNDFHTDLKEAQHEERNLGDWIEDLTAATVINSQDKGSFSDWDLSVDLHNGDEPTTLELKMDKQTSQTGNVAVEVGRTLANGTYKDTVLMVSKADYFVYLMFGSYYFILTSRLKEMVAQNIHFMTVNGAGDGDRARIVLFKLEVFTKNCNRIYKITNK